MKNLRIVVLLCITASLTLCLFGFAATKRKPPPTRAFDAPGSPTFIRLDGKPGVNPPADVDGNFLIGPEYLPAPERRITKGVAQGKVHQFSIKSTGCTLYNPGIARKVFGAVDPANPKTLIVDTHEIDFTRTRERLYST